MGPPYSKITIRFIHSIYVVYRVYVFGTGHMVVTRSAYSDSTGHILDVRLNYQHRTSDSDSRGTIVYDYMCKANEAINLSCEGSCEGLCEGSCEGC